MRDRGRQFSGCRIAVDMREFRQALARLDLGETAATTFVEHSADQRPLDEDHARDQRQLPTVSFPDARLTKQDFTSRGQVALADAPPLHLAPVVLRRRKSDRLDLDISRLLPTDDADRRSDRLLPRSPHPIHPTTATFPPHTC